MKTLTNIIDEMAKADDVLKIIGNDLRRYSPTGMKYWDREPEAQLIPDRKEVMLGIRGLGNWKLPSHIDPRSTEAQDYDWKVLDEKSYKQILKDFKNWVRSRPWANLVAEIVVSPEEKQWVLFRVKIKNRLFIKTGTI